MSFTLFLQVFFNIAILTAVFVIFARLRRPAKDDPRMSKGLQLLSSKIAVLEDLNDRTETQVQQMLTLLDQKSRELQAKISLAEQQVQAVRQSMDQSLEVAQIFQDKIPHTEIIERQNSIKYIKAARLAHAGYSAEQIAAQVDLPMGEIEFIAKVNRDSLSFREEELPAWAREPSLDQPNAADGYRAASFEQTPPAPESQFQPPVPQPELSAEQAGLVNRLNRLQFEMKNLDLELANRAMAPGKDLSMAFESPQAESDRLAEIGQRFRQAVVQTQVTAQIAEPAPPAPAITTHVPQAQQQQSQAYAAAPLVAPIALPASPPVAKPVAPELEAARAAAQAIRQKNSVSISEVRKVEFPRI